jgi:hypothetical protein
VLPPACMHACMQHKLTDSCLSRVLVFAPACCMQDDRLSPVTTLAPASLIANVLQWICRRHMSTEFTVCPHASQDQLPRITPPASPAHSEETVGFAPHHSAAEAKSCAEVKRASEDPTDISSHWRATKRRRCCMPIRMCCDMRYQLPCLVECAPPCALVGNATPRTHMHVVASACMHLLQTGWQA